MRSANIALIGFRATGKSSVGRILAARLGLIFVDLDEEITRAIGMEIRDFVALHGWDAFRDEETSALCRVCADNGVVLAAGGGLVLREANRALLRRRFFNIRLDAAFETIRARILGDPGSPASRPPLTDLAFDEEIRSLLAARAPLYAEVADLTLDTEPFASAVETAEALLTALDRTNPAEPINSPHNGHTEEHPMVHHWWVKEIACAITVCDTQGIITYMNDKSIEGFQSRGGARLVGTNLLDCHPEPARTLLAQMLANQTPHVFSTEKDGVKRLYYETPLYENGVYKGFVEIGMEIPADAPHYVKTPSQG